MSQAPEWSANERFKEEAARFAAYRLTDEYRTEEVEYKAALGAVLQALTAPGVLGVQGASGLASLFSGPPDLDGIALSATARELVDKSPPHDSLRNLLGLGPATDLQLVTFSRWAASDGAAVAAAVGELLHGAAPISERFDAFMATGQAAYGRLFAAGALRAKEAPPFASELPAILLALTRPDLYGLYRPAVYGVAAASFDYPLDLTGSFGERYARTTAMLEAFRDGLRAEGCPVEDLLEVHNLLWIRAKYPGWSGLGDDRWADGDFDAMRTDRAQDPAPIGLIQAKLRRVGDALKGELHRRTGREFQGAVLGTYPPSRRSWPWLTMSLGEARFGSQRTARPQLNVEIGAQGLDVFYAVDLRSGTVASAPVRARVHERRGEPALLGAATAIGYAELEDDAGRYMVRRRIPRATVVEWPGLGIEELTAEFDTLLPIYEAMAAPPATAAPAPPRGGTVDPLFIELAAALEDRGQAILYGPPGTGKTWNGHRFALWWLTQRWGGDADAVLADPAHAIAADTRLTRAQRERRAWWVVANPAEWTWDRLFADGTVEYRYGRVKPNYELIQEGDLVVGYQANPDKRIVALARIAKRLHDTPDGPRITLEPVAKVPHGLTYEDLVADPVMAVSEPMRLRNQGTLFRLTSIEADVVLAALSERNSDLPNLEGYDPVEGIGPLTRVTFHASYGYEDFVEGYRPVPSATGQLNLTLTAGVFKRVCQAARADPAGRPYLLLIDEINRGNIAKIFGELITLIERDKRDQAVVLPQSGDPFSVPQNVFLLGTMNTADRSIRLLDAALRRRFAFIELLPDVRPLGDAQVGDLPLATFLSGLNLRIIERHGREKQVGQSFLLDGGKPVGTPALFAARFRREILPLLQEYAYDDFRELIRYLGTDLVDGDQQRVLAADLSSSELVAALAAEYGATKEAEVEEVV
jgi:hypothetical protein